MVRYGGRKPAFVPVMAVGLEIALYLMVTLLETTKAGHA
jgi:hypothetical protein